MTADCGRCSGSGRGDYPAPVIRARRRVETPPGAQAQVDWTHFSQVVVSVPHTPNVASEWMRAILQKDISLDVLHSEIGDVPELETLLQRLYDGRLSDRTGRWSSSPIAVD